MSHGEQNPEPSGPPGPFDPPPSGPPPSGPPPSGPPPSGPPAGPPPSGPPHPGPFSPPGAPRPGPFGPPEPSGTQPGGPPADDEPSTPGSDSPAHDEPSTPRPDSPGPGESRSYPSHPHHPHHGEPGPAQSAPTLDELRPTNEVTTVAPERGAILRDPANRVSRSAIAYWTLTAVITGIFVMGAASVAYFVAIPEKWWWATALYVLAATVTAIEIFIAPSYRYAVHRWEITGIAIYTRVGWLTRSQRIAPLSRVQTVDTNQGALMRLFGLSSVTVTTASAAGPISIDGLKNDLAQRVVADLTTITSATVGDAT